MTALALPAPAHAAEPPGPAVTIDDRGLELRWTVRVDGRPAAIHTLRSHGERGRALLTGAGLAPWSSACPLAPDLHWTSDVRPRVLRPTDSTAPLEIDDTAPAISIHEHGRDRGGLQLVHEAIVLAGFVAFAQPMLDATQRLPRSAHLHALASD